MSDAASWSLLDTCPDHIAAEMLQERLKLNGIPSQLRSATPLLGALQPAQVLVPTALLHRARWLLQESAADAAELDWLATGELGRGEDQPE